MIGNITDVDQVSGKEMIDMSSVAERKFMEEMSFLLQRDVIVRTTDGRTFTGILSGVSAGTLSICLTNARDNSGKMIHKLFLNGRSVVEISCVERPFGLRNLAERLERVFPRMVKVIEEAGVIVVMDKIRVTEKGITEGTGPAAERVQRVYDEFMKDQTK